MKIKLAFGIDIGGHITKIGIVNQDGYIYETAFMRTSDYPHMNNYNNFICDLSNVMNNMLDKLSINYELIGIGIGVPNADSISGTSISPVNLWTNIDNNNYKPRVFPIVDDFKYKFPNVTDIHITDDANAAALGELVFGHGKNLANFILITIGTGLGGGIIINKEVYSGHTGFAGEIGHVIIQPDGRECSCGRRGCLETYISASGLKRTVADLISKTNLPSPLREIPYNSLDTYLISQAAEANDTIAIKAYEYTGSILGLALANIAAIISPEAFVLVGGISNANNLLIESTRHSFDKNSLFLLKNKIEILRSKLKPNESAIKGAAALIFKNHKVQ